MSLHAVLDDITTMQVDCIVNAAKRTLMGGGGVDGAIHRVAGPELLAECKRIKGDRLTACEFGQAVLTAGYNLPARYVIHTVGPVWQGGDKGEAEILASCYRNSLSVFAELDCKSIAFPAISCGVYGYPKEEAAPIAVRECQNFLRHHPEREVYLVAMDEETFSLFENAITAG